MNKITKEGHVLPEALDSVLTTITRVFKKQSGLCSRIAAKITLNGNASGILTSGNSSASRTWNRRVLC